MQRLMTTDEIGDVLWRNPTVYARVLAHKALVATGQWSQVNEAGWGEIELGELPIRPSGYAFVDERFGSVIIFPGADGKLYFNTNVTPEAAAAVNLPPYTSPTGNTPAQIIADIKGVLQGIVTGAVWVALAIGGLLLYRELR